jgi:flagellar biosynthesis/type III secretory pathway protein FliH
MTLNEVTNEYALQARWEDGFEDGYEKGFEKGLEKVRTKMAEQVRSLIAQGYTTEQLKELLENHSPLLF